MLRPPSRGHALDVAVHDPVGVQEGDGGDELRENGAGLGLGDGPAAGEEQVGQVAAAAEAGDQLEDEHHFGGRVHRKVQADEVRVAQGAQELDFAGHAPSASKRPRVRAPRPVVGAEQHVLVVHLDRALRGRVWVTGGEGAKTGAVAVTMLRVAPAPTAANAPRPRWRESPR